MAVARGGQWCPGPHLNSVPPFHVWQPELFDNSNFAFRFNVFCAPTETLVQRTNDANKVGQAFF